MSKITTLNEKAIAVEVEKEEDSFVSYYFVGTDNMLYANFGQIDYPLEVELPPGSWSLLGRPNEITEEQWKGIVDQQRGGGKFRHYDIEGSSLAQYGSYMLNNATESGLSLLKSKGLNPSEVIILIKQ